VAVGVEGESRRVVAQVALHRFHIIPAVQGVDGISVPQIVKAQIGNAQGSGYALEFAIHRVRNEMPPERVCEYQVVRVAPGGPGLQLVPLLPYTLPTQHGHDAGGRRDGAGLVVLRRCKHESILPALFEQLLTDTHCTALEVHVVPGEDQHLPLAHFREHGDEEYRLELMALYGLQEGRQHIIWHRLNVWPLNPWQRDIVGGVALDIPEPLRLLQSTVKYPVRVLDRLRRKPLDPLHIVIALLHIVGVELLQLGSAQRGLDIVFKHPLIVIFRVRLYAAQVFSRPDIQPLRNGHFGRL